MGTPGLLAEIKSQLKARDGFMVTLIGAWHKVSGLLHRSPSADNGGGVVVTLPS